VRNDRGALIRLIQQFDVPHDVAEALAKMAFDRRTPSPKRRPGRPPWIPTDEERDKVMRLRASGVPAQVIALCLGIEEPTLRKRYGKELETGRAMVKAALGNVVVRSGLRGDWRAAIGWLARFGGEEWQKPNVHLVGGLPGNPVKVENRVSIYLPENRRPPVTIPDREPDPVSDWEPFPPC
jgi:hypothetical protein